MQQATFGRQLSGTDDTLTGFGPIPLKIEDQELVTISGKEYHTMAKFTGRTSDAVSGTLFRLMKDELRKADTHQVPAVKRVAVVLRSGMRAWAYVDAR